MVQYILTRVSAEAHYGHDYWQVWQVGKALSAQLHPGNPNQIPIY